MSLATDSNQEATADLTANAGADLWTSFGIPSIAARVALKHVTWRVSLGGNATFRGGFRTAAESDGFTTANVLLSNDFDVNW